jgi:hypothetical protein
VYLKYCQVGTHQSKASRKGNLKPQRPAFTLAATTWPGPGWAVSDPVCQEGLPCPDHIDRHSFRIQQDMEEAGMTRPQL